MNKYRILSEVIVSKQTIKDFNLGYNIELLGDNGWMFVFQFLEVVDNTYKFAKKGLKPSQIGVIFRDSRGIAHVSSQILCILKSHDNFVCFLFLVVLKVYLILVFLVLEFNLLLIF